MTSMHENQKIKKPENLSCFFHEENTIDISSSEVYMFFFLYQRVHETKSTLNKTEIIRVI